MGETERMAGEIVAWLLIGGLLGLGAVSFWRIASYVIERLTREGDR